jgi:hypothetical protein
VRRGEGLGWATNPSIVRDQPLVDPKPTQPGIDDARLAIPKLPHIAGDLEDREQGIPG